MWMNRKLGVLSLVLLAACASAPADMGPPPLDPVGTYTLTVMIQGSAVNGQMRIRGEPGSYTGAVYTDFTGELPINSVSVDGNRMFISAGTPDGPVDVEITFDGDTFTGTWVLGADGGALQGRKVNP